MKKEQGVAANSAISQSYFPLWVINHNIQSQGIPSLVPIFVIFHSNLIKQKEMDVRDLSFENSFFSIALNLQTI